MPIGDNSFLWHVRAGIVQLNDGQVLTADPFSFTALGEPWRTQSWLAELGYGWLFELIGGIAWVPAMKFLAIGMTLLLLGLVAYRASAQSHGITLVVLLLLAWQAATFSIARPALLGFVLFAACVALLATTRRPLWALPMLFSLWASVHGGFVVGLAYVVLDGIRRRSVRQLVAAMAAGLATAFTAHGIGAWGLLWRFAQSREALSRIAEWQPPDMLSLAVLPFLLLLIGLVVAGAYGRLQQQDLWVVIPFLLFGLSAGRNVWLAVMALAPVLVGAAARQIDAPTAQKRESFTINWAIAAVLIGFVVVVLVDDPSLREDRFPSDAALAALSDGYQWNDSAVGGYLIYRSDLGRLVYGDDRAELYGPDWYNAYVDMGFGIGVESGLEAYGVDQAIVRVDSPLGGYLDLLDWDTRYEDEYFLVMSAPGSR